LSLRSFQRPGQKTSSFLMELNRLHSKLYNKARTPMRMDRMRMVAQEPMYLRLRKTIAPLLATKTGAVTPLVVGSLWSTMR
jgi:hypothetical protein